MAEVKPQQIPWIIKDEKETESGEEEVKQQKDMFRINDGHNYPYL